MYTSVMDRNAAWDNTWQNPYLPAIFFVSVILEDGERSWGGGFGERGGASFKSQKKTEGFS